MSDRAEYIKGLRALADILEANADLPLPFDGDHCPIEFIEVGEAARLGAAVFARVMPAGTREVLTGTHFYVEAEVHGLHLRWVGPRDETPSAAVSRG